MFMQAGTVAKPKADQTLSHRKLTNSERKKKKENETNIKSELTSLMNPVYNTLP